MNERSHILEMLAGGSVADVVILTPFQVAPSPAVIEAVTAAAAEAAATDDPLDAMSRLALLDRLAAARSGWGLQPPGAISLVIDTPAACDDVDALTMSVLKHLDGVVVLRFDPMAATPWSRSGVAMEARAHDAGNSPALSAPRSVPSPAQPVEQGRLTLRAEPEPARSPEVLASLQSSPAPPAHPLRRRAAIEAFQPPVPRRIALGQPRLRLVEADAPTPREGAEANEPRPGGLMDASVRSSDIGDRPDDAPAAVTRDELAMLLGPDEDDGAPPATGRREAHS
jgi:hypothetical protein